MSAIPLVEVVRISKDYGPFVALRDVSFHVVPGEVVALLGTNGAGKTTMMRILTGVLSATRGQALIAGLDVAVDRLALASRLGYLPENGPLYLDMTPLALLQFFAEARGVCRARRRERIDAVADDCSLHGLLERPIYHLSKGQRQRVGLAQALVHDPDIVVLDEPTAGLDPNQIRRFREHVARLRGNKTLLVCTHVLQEVEAVADRVLLLHGGRLVFDGPLDGMPEGGSLERSFYRLTHETC
jgi:ABC-2 type transport system ATP-binding protein